MAVSVSCKETRSQEHEEIQPFGAFPPKAWHKSVIAITRQMPLTWVGRRVALWLRKPILLSLKKSPIDLEVLGFKMRLLPHDNVSEKRVLAMPQFFDHTELKLIEKRMKPGFQLVDVGANAGLYSLFVAARAGEDARILAVEAQSEMQHRLAENIALNGFSTIYQANCAVANRTGEIIFKMGNGNRGEAGIVRDEDSYVSATSQRPSSSVSLNDNHQTKQVVTIPCFPLLQLMDEAGISQPDAMKIDIEGAEDIVLGHFLRTAPRHRWPKLLFMERNQEQWREDLLALCLSKGYALYGDGGRMNMILELNDA